MIVNTKLFKKAVQTAKRYKVELIELQVLHDEIKVIADDKEHGVAITVSCSQSTLNTSVKVALNPLLNALKNGKNENISVEIRENVYIVGSYTLPCIVGGEAFPQIDNKEMLKIDSTNLIKAFKKVSPAMASKSPKFELNGALLSIDDNGCDIVATDTKRLARSHLPHTNTQELRLIIPNKAIIEIQKLFTDTMDIYYDDTTLIIQKQNYTFYTRIIQGRYPDYARIIPKKSRYNLQLPKNKMIESIKMITPICKNITMVISPNSMIFKPLPDDVGEVKTELLINLELEHNFEINVNSQYLLDFLMQVDAETFDFLFSEDNFPFLLQEGAFQMVVMPIIL